MGANNASLFKNFTQLALPDQSGPLFSAMLTPGMGGVNTANNSGIWAVDSTGQPSLMVRKGQWMDSNGTAKSIALDPEFIGKPDSYNQAGGFLYKATFSDGSQAINKAQRQ